MSRAQILLLGADLCAFRKKAKAAALASSGLSVFIFCPFSFFRDMQYG